MVLQCAQAPTLCLAIGLANISSLIGSMEEHNTSNIRTLVPTPTWDYELSEGHAILLGLLDSTESSSRTARPGVSHWGRATVGDSTRAASRSPLTVHCPPTKSHVTTHTSKGSCGLAHQMFGPSALGPASGANPDLAPSWRRIHAGRRRGRASEFLFPGASVPSTALPPQNSPGAQGLQWEIRSWLCRGCTGSGSPARTQHRSLLPTEGRPDV